MSGDAVRTVLAPDRQSLALPLGCSVGFHAGLLIAAAAGRLAYAALLAVLTLVAPQCAAPEPPLLESIEVFAVAMPKSERNVPTRAARVERAEGTQAPPEPKPPPVKTSDIAVKTEAPPPKPGNTEEDLRRQEILDRIERNRMLDDLINAPDGAVDRDASDPEGVGVAASNAAVAAGARGDPEYARWYAEIQRLIMGRFKPLGADPSLRANGKISVDAQTGRITNTALIEPSGALAFDAAAERAMQGLGAIPLPPEKYLPMLRGGITFEFVPP